MSSFTMDAKSFENIADTIMKFSDGREAEDIINSYLANEGGELLKEGIQNLLPVSGRSWAGKMAPAKTANPFRKTPGNLQVKISTVGKYNYLYFPDDGSNTVHHQGNQQFMFFGAEQKAAEIGSNIVDKLLEKLEG